MRKRLSTGPREEEAGMNGDESFASEGPLVAADAGWEPKAGAATSEPSRYGSKVKDMIPVKDE